MSETPKTVWVTRWLFECGIVECDTFGRYGGLIVVNSPIEPEQTHVRSVDWHTTREAAVTRAEQMRSAKLASLGRGRRRSGG